MPTINTNVAAIKARSNLDRVQRDMDTSIARLSSGKRITRAHDEAAGSAIAGRMESQIRGLNQQIKAKWFKNGHRSVVPKPYYFLDKHNMKEEREEVIYRLSYLAKVRGKGYRSAQAKDYSTSRLKYKLS